MKPTYIEPQIGLKKFTCPHCNTLTNFQWHFQSSHEFENIHVNGVLVREKNIHIGKCFNCEKTVLYHMEKLLYPESTGLPHANEHMSDEVKKFYNEAASVFNKSKRASAALLRLALQILCKELGGQGKIINKDIEFLVREKNLSPQIQKALDSVRIVANESVHPGQIDVEDEDISGYCFELLNVIVEEMIEKPKKLEEFYDKIIPANKKDGIANRDK
ncbi:MAG: DUF4145 domain-containing protein [Fusobacteriaceae bacterium]